MKRREDLPVAVLARVHVQHEIDEGALQPGPCAEVEREAGAGDLGGALEIQDAEARADVPVGLRLEVEARRLAPGLDHGVVRAVPADRYRGVRQVGDAHQQAVQPLLGLPERALELLDAAGDRAHLEDQRFGVFARFFHARDLVRYGVAAVPQFLDLQKRAAVKLVDFPERLQGGTLPAGGQRSLDCS